jgi:DNA-binding CsgD family transcriptional regulator
MVVAEAPGDPAAEARFAGLTARERQIVALIVTGLDNAQIAAREHVSPYTVKTHATLAMAKAGVRDRALLLRFPFERWTMLHGYEAILDPGEQCIVAQVTLRGTPLSKIPGVIVGSPEQAEPISEDIAKLRIAFSLPGPSLGPSTLMIAGTDPRLCNT